MTIKSAFRAGLTAALLGATTLATAPGLSMAASEAAAVVQPTPPSIRVATVRRGTVIETLPVNGTVVPREEAAAGTDLNGMIVTALNADEGDVVKKGDVLAVLDRSTLETQLAQMTATRAQAEASIAQVDAQIADAEVGVRQAGEAHERARALQAKGIATKAELDNSVNARDSAGARLDSARKALVASQAQLGVIDAQTRNIQLQLEKTEVRAPADGLVLSRNATLGGIVSASGGPLFRIAIGGEFELAAEIAETALSRLEPGMKAELWLAGRTDPVEGSVRRISPEVDARTRLGSVRIKLDPEARAHAGNFGRGRIETLRREGMLVPAAAIVYRDRDAFIQLVADGRIESRPVEIGVRMGADVELLSGVEPGAEIVSRAGTFVADGDLVTPVPDDATGAIVR